LFQSNYEPLNRNNDCIGQWSWYYRGCWHQTCPPLEIQILDYNICYIYYIKGSELLKLTAFQLSTRRAYISRTPEEVTMLSSCHFVTQPLQLVTASLNYFYFLFSCCKIITRQRLFDCFYLFIYLGIIIVVFKLLIACRRTNCLIYMGLR